MRVIPGAPAPGLTGLSAKQYGPNSTTGSPSIVPGTAGQGGVAQQPQQPRTAGTGLPIKTHKNHLFTLGPL